MKSWYLAQVSDISRHSFEATNPGTMEGFL
jgi:hypothetical protein